MNDYDIQVGDRVTYKQPNNNEQINIVISKAMTIASDNITIKKIERIGPDGWYTVYEKEEEINNYDEMLEDYERQKEIEKLEKEIENLKKKDLLTEEEREFLKLYMKLIGFEKDIEYIQKEDYHTLFLYLSDDSHFGFEITVENFVNIENYQKYTLSELGLEE